VSPFEKGPSVPLIHLVLSLWRVKERRSLSYTKIFPLSLEGEGDNGGGKGVSDLTEKTKTE